MTAAAADLLFSSTTGAGLSLHRIQVPYDGSGGETSIAQMSQARGARVWATPWSPPPTYKDNNNDVEGHLSNASGFASFLVSWVNSMKSAGVNIYAVSSQNEPDANVTYASCAYTPAQLASFVGGSMGPAFAGTGVNILSPETENWCDLPGYLSALESDTAAWAAVNIIATHDYGCNAAAQPMIQQAGKEFWQTEIYDVTGASGIASGLEVASRIYSALVTANVNAWHYWYACSSGNGGLLDANCNATKRLWVEGNFSRFARPGFYRIDVSHAPSSASIVAFGNPADGTTVIVAINAGNSDVSASFFVTGACWPSSVTPWVTSASDDLAAQAAIPVSGGRFSATLPAQTVTSFVGRP
jgi:glucuronoarabinoxylan endo-1,4-beta-xylanase